MEISQNFVAFSVYMNFTYYRTRRLTEWVVSASPGTTTLGWTKKITSTLFFVKVLRYFCFGILKKIVSQLFLNKYARLQEINRIFPIGKLKHLAHFNTYSFWKTMIFVDMFQGKTAFGYFPVILAINTVVVNFTFFVSRR